MGEQEPTVAPFPWHRAMQMGFGVLRLSSREFWAMTPRELAAAIEAIFGEAATPLDRTTLDGMMRRFPDGTP